MSSAAGEHARRRGAGPALWGLKGAGDRLKCPLHPSLPFRQCAGDILIRFRDSITNWEALKANGNIDGWDDSTPTYLWSGVVLDFDLRVREV